MTTNTFCLTETISIRQKVRGIRLIVVGYMLRRLAAKCASAYANETLVGYFSFRQVGIGVPGGCEAVVHAVRRFMDSMPDDHVIVKLDFSNAFNCLHRHFMLERVAEVYPEIYMFCHLAYNQHSTLQFGDFSISSQSWKATVLPRYSSNIVILVLPLSFGFMDDITIGGARSTVASDEDQFRSEGRKIGLHLNDAKCEVITKVTTSLVLNFTDLLIPSPTMHVYLVHR